MLEYNKINVSEVIDFNKTTDSRESDVRHYLWFLKINLRFQRKDCDGCHNLTQKALSFNGIAVGSVKGNY